MNRQIAKLQVWKGLYTILRFMEQSGAVANPDLQISGGPILHCRLVSQRLGTKSYGPRVWSKIRAQPGPPTSFLNPLLWCVVIFSELRLNFSVTLRENVGLVCKPLVLEDGASLVSCRKTSLCRKTLF